MFYIFTILSILVSVNTYLPISRKNESGFSLIPDLNMSSS